MIQKNLLPTDSDVQFFQEKGYWLAEKIISNEGLEELRKHMDRVYDLDYETGVSPWSSSWKPGGRASALRKTDNSFWADYTLRDLALDTTIGAIASKLMKTSPIRLWHDQLLYKPGGGHQTDGNVGWHQDYGYWQCAHQPFLITAWVAFDDVTEENGCMKVVPKSHKWGLLPESDFFNPNLKEQEEKIKKSTGGKWEVVPCILKAGEVSFHHAMTIHGSGPNKTDKPRRSLAVHLMAGDIKYQPGTPADPHMNVVLLKNHGGKEGDLFAGELFPTLYPEEPHPRVPIDPGIFRP